MTNTISRSRAVKTGFQFASMLRIILIGASAACQTAPSHYQPSQPAPAQAAKKSSFEVASIRASSRGWLNSFLPQMETIGTQPDGYLARNQPLSSTIVIAYLPLTYSWTEDSAPLHEPSWTHEQYDIQARVASSDLAAWQKQGPPKEMLQAMLQSLLEDRCKLKVHWMETQAAGYALVVAKRGPSTQSRYPQLVAQKGVACPYWTAADRRCNLYPLPKGGRTR